MLQLLPIKQKTILETIMTLSAHIIIDAAMLTIIIILACGILMVRNLFSAIIISGVFSMNMAALFVLLAAPDVAFTEAAVGGGFSTILMLAAMGVLRQEEKLKPEFKLTPFLFILATGAIVFFGTLDLAPHGSKVAAPHLHVAPSYLERSIPDTGVPNVVTSILASYRGFDTLGEVFVIFTAGIAVLALIGVGINVSRNRKI